MKRTLWSMMVTWGVGCNKNLVNLNLHNTDGQSIAVKSGQINTGKYLIVSFDNSPILALQEVKLTLFDTGPYSIQIGEQKKDETRRSQERIKF